MNDIEKLVVTNLILFLKSKPNHFFAYQFYAWAKKQGITITLEFKKAFRTLIKSYPQKFKTQKTSYKSSKVYIFLVGTELKIRKYTKKIFQSVKQVFNFSVNSLKDYCAQITQKNLRLRS